jgi:hypothetical protein
MDVQEMVTRSQDAATVGRVYGEPYVKDGTTIIPAARVSARGGAGAARGGEHSGGVETSSTRRAPPASFLTSFSVMIVRPIPTCTNCSLSGSIIGPYTLKCVE